MPRSDARLNRERILDAARTVLGAGGEPSMNAVAKAAGIGPGTLYRHFPTRDDLVTAVFRADVDELAAAVGPLLEQHGPLEALDRWLVLVVERVHARAGLADTLAGAEASALYAVVRDALAELLRAGIGAGQVRAEPDPDDVVLVVGLLCRADVTPERAARLVDLLLHGLAARTAA
ncbi:TetR/AcrR family transcriptional regulator [Actinomycetospora flava]|uniref:TetR/AcrR family transcriptional regulator n=1 Tax=Actinomycetospora flava TaxID=3129232 RepID=A0ABU8M064_9PSEU